MAAGLVAEAEEQPPWGRLVAPRSGPVAEQEDEVEEEEEQQEQRTWAVVVAVTDT